MIRVAHLVCAIVARQTRRHHDQHRRGLPRAQTQRTRKVEAGRARQDRDVARELGREREWELQVCVPGCGELVEGAERYEQV